MSDNPPHERRDDASSAHRPNRLIDETSPYLLQHAYNPVDWYAWGPEALQQARELDKPILLSIGYSACHWCHVMERESFEDEATARLMNDLFVNIKVDREERPDLDSIYMQAVQALTQHGGWPMTVFLTPDGEPFYGGTYFPPVDRYGMPSFQRVLQSVAHAYREQRSAVDRTAQQLTTLLRRSAVEVRPPDDDAALPTAAVLNQATQMLGAAFDTRYGGFGSAPKFPQPMNLELLLRRSHHPANAHLLPLVEKTLEGMARGGIYDHLGGGFHRYSTDAQWLVPHFEKMLYDNAQLVCVYLHAYQLTGKELYRRVVEEVLAYVEREMTDPAGGFYSTQDADSEGEEGLFFVWTPDEIRQSLSPDEARLFELYYDVTPDGNFEGKNIIHMPRDEDVVAHLAGVSVEQLRKTLARARQRLWAVREQRVKPDRDEKVLTSWNGLMLRAFAEAGAVLDRDDYRQRAVANGEFLWEQLRSTDSAGRVRLFHSWKEGRATLNGYLEDYAYLADGYLALYEATFDPVWITRARALTDTMRALFLDSSGGGFFDTASDHETLIARPKDLLDNATPAGNSVAAEAVIRLAALIGDWDAAEPALALFRALGNTMAQHPSAFGRLLSALDLFLAPPKEVAIVAPPGTTTADDLLRLVLTAYLPSCVLAFRSEDDAAAADLVPLLAGRATISGSATAYVCQRFTCKLPVTEPSALQAQLTA